MSHFTSVKTKIKNLKSLKKTIEEVFPGYEILENETVRGYEGVTKSDIVIRGKKRNYDIGFTKVQDGTYTIVSDWWGANREFGTEQSVIQRIQQGYSKNLVKAQAKKFGFFVKEEAKQDGTIQLQLTKY